LLTWRRLCTCQCSPRRALDRYAANAAEPKFDGWRTIVPVDPSLPNGIEVRSRTGRFLTTQVPVTASPTSGSAWCSTANSSQ
jgi:ATP-dependent DNA ligase